MNRLEALLSDNFADLLSALSTTQSVHDVLGRSSEVRAIKDALATGELTTGQVRDFVQQLVADFRPGTRFHGDLVLAALATAFETVNDEIAETYLQRLAALDISELPVSRRVARLVLTERPALLASGLTTRQFTFGIVNRFTELLLADLTTDVRAFSDESRSDRATRGARVSTGESPPLRLCLG